MLLISGKFRWGTASTIGACVEENERYETSVTLGQWLPNLLGSDTPNKNCQIRDPFLARLKKGNIFFILCFRAHSIFARDSYLGNSCSRLIRAKIIRMNVPPMARSVMVCNSRWHHYYQTISQNNKIINMLRSTHCSYNNVNNPKLTPTNESNLVKEVSLSKFQQ